MGTGYFVRKNPRVTKWRGSIVAVFLFLGAFMLDSKRGYISQAQASDGPDIPEPMVFDLVRGLGAKQGEIEINVLGSLNLTKQEQGLHWAPEIEYVLVDGWAIELEIPLQNTSIKALKFAVQGTFGTAAKDKFIHGGQALVEYFLDNQDAQLALLYLFGYRVNSVFSFFVMAGVEGGYIFSTQEPVIRGILNPSLFFNATQHLVVGLETNLSYGSKEGFAALLMPQMQFRFGQIVAVQFGVGALYEHQQFSLAMAFRLVVQERLVNTPKPEDNGTTKPTPPPTRK